MQVEALHAALNLIHREMQSKGDAEELVQIKMQLEQMEALRTHPAMLNRGGAATTGKGAYLTLLSHLLNNLLCPTWWSFLVRLILLTHTGYNVSTLLKTCATQWFVYRATGLWILTLHTTMAAQSEHQIVSLCARLHVHHSRQAQC